MKKGCREAAFLLFWFLRPSGALLYRLLISGTMRNPVGVTDNKQAVSTPADNTDDIPIGTP